MEFNTLHEWCKWLENNFSPEVMIPTLPVIIRLDGNNFSTWTKDLNQPFDKGFSTLMEKTTEALVKETNAVVGYTQSDEITLILYSPNKKNAIYHDGKKSKILSKLTAKCVNFFNDNKDTYIQQEKQSAVFDARVYQTPTLDDAANQLLWRENDASKNSINMLAGYHFSHNSLDGLNGDQRQDKLITEKGVNWNDLEVRFKRGVYIKRFKTSRPYTAEELDSLPEMHDARRNPDLLIERNVFKRIEYPIFNKITNRADVIFSDEEPILKTENETV